MNEALLPCPFCGAECHFEIDDEQWQWVECGRCKMQSNRSVSLMEDCKPTLTAAWNCRAALSAAPAQERIDALELEVRQLSEQAAGLRGALIEIVGMPTSHATVPVRDYAMQDIAKAALAGTAPAVAPWRSAVLGLIDDCPGLTLEQDRWLSRRVKELDFATTPQPTQVADSVLEDAARYRWLTADHHKQEDRIRVYDIATSMNVRRKRSIDAAIDAARKQGEKP